LTKNQTLSQDVTWHCASILPAPCFTMPIHKGEIRAAVVPIGREVNHHSERRLRGIKTSHVDGEPSIINAVFALVDEYKCPRRFGGCNFRKFFELPVSSRIRTGIRKKTSIPVAHVTVH